MSVACDEPGCERGDNNPLPNAGALRIHKIAKHDAAKGVCELCDPPKSYQNLPAHQTKAHTVDLGGGHQPSGPGEAAAEGEHTQERPPSTADYLDEPATSSPPPRKGGRLAARVRSRLWGGDDTPADQPAGDYGADEKRPRPKVLGGRRATTAPICSLAWGGVGAMLERSGADVPVGRTLQFQADMAGDILDRLIAKTWVDRVLQPLAQKTDDIEALSALIALPVLVATMERAGEATASTLEPLLRQAVRSNLTGMAPVVKRKRAEEKRWVAAVADIDPQLAGTDDPVGAILAAIFAPAPQPPPTQEEPGANGHDAADVAAPI